MVCIEKRPYTLYGRLATLHFRYLTCLLDRGHINVGLPYFMVLSEGWTHNGFFQYVNTPVNKVIKQNYP